MGIAIHALETLKPYLTKSKVLSLGYPDLLVKASDIERLFGYKPEKLNTRNQKWHGLSEPSPDTFELFEKLGSDLTIVDCTSETGHEKIADLNYPHDFGKFDLVIDPGTVEHCFNIGQAIMNAAGAVRDGGVICHLSPMDMLNHGFYNICPTLFNDFYGQNGWNLKSIAIMPSGVPNSHRTSRFTMHTEHFMVVIAERNMEEPFKFPTQTKYLKKMGVVA